MESPQLSQDFFSSKISIEPVKIGQEAGLVKEKILTFNDVITQISIKEFNKIFQKCNGLTSDDKREVANKNSLGYAIKKRSEQINNYDEIQFKALYESEFQNMRIRGLAGSGKTILLVKKMAYLHFQIPDLKMAYVFYTKSLQQYITEMFKKLYFKTTNNYK